MSEVRFVFDLLYQGLMAVLYGAVAWAVSRRKVSTSTELANMAFMHWWAGLSIFSFVGLIAAIIGRAQAWTLVGFLTYLDVVIVLLVYLLMALMYYFVFLFTGSNKATLVVVAFYVGFLAFLFYFFNAQQPIGLTYENGVAEVQYANDLSESSMGVWLSIGLLAPLVLGALAYASLYFQVEDRTQRFRIATVGGSIFLWMLTALGGSLGGVDESATWWLIVSRAVAILATVANFIAFRPPAWLRERLGLRSVEDQSAS